MKTVSAQCAPLVHVEHAPSQHVEPFRTPLAHSGRLFEDISFWHRRIDSILVVGLGATACRKRFLVEVTTHPRSLGPEHRRPIFVMTWLQHRCQDPWQLWQGRWRRCHLVVRYQRDFGDVSSEAGGCEVRFRPSTQTVGPATQVFGPGRSREPRAPPDP